MESSISLEETNKIRVSLGLKPLVDDGAPVDIKEKAAEDNYVETREREKAERRTKSVLRSNISFLAMQHKLTVSSGHLSLYVIAKSKPASKSEYTFQLSNRVQGHCEPIFSLLLHILGVLDEYVSVLITRVPLFSVCIQEEESARAESTTSWCNAW